jgi:uracil-DNA glycosylase
LFSDTGMPLPEPLPILHDIAGCTRCAAHLPHGPRPVVQASASARLLIVGQAPGRRVHDSGIPWNDPSGDQLRSWLQLTREQFYDERRIAIVPIGFCYPGKGRSGDLPPRPECAPQWHQPLLQTMPAVRLTLLIGAYAQAFYLGRRGDATLTETVARHRDYLPAYFPLPHPSPRNRFWLSRNPWFARDVLPELAERVRAALHE